MNASASRAAQSCVLILALTACGEGGAGDRRFEPNHSAPQTSDSVPHKLELISQAITLPKKAVKPSMVDQVRQTCRNAKDLIKPFEDFLVVGDYVQVALQIGTALGVFEKAPDPNFVALHQALDQLGSALSWQMGGLAQDGQWGVMKAGLTITADLHKSGTPPVLGSNQDMDTLAAINTAMGSSAFHRFYSKNAIEGPWTKVISNRAAITNGLVYDWRAGVPFLMKMISARLSIIAMLDPDFRHRERFRAELRDYRDALRKHYTQMVDGIVCGEKDHFVVTSNTVYMLGKEISCADVHTGGSATSDKSGITTGFVRWGETPVFPDQALITATRQDLYMDVLNMMPLAEMIEMIDSLSSAMNQWYPAGVSEGTMVAAEGDPAVYWLAAGQRYWAPNFEDVDALGGWGNFSWIDPAAQATIPVGPARGTFVHQWNDGAVYRITGDLTKQWVETPQIMVAMGGWSPLRRLPSGVVTALPNWAPPKTVPELP